MFTKEEARELLSLPKIFANKSDTFIDLSETKHRIKLLPEDKDLQKDYSFFVQIFASKKQDFKISLYHQEFGTKIGLLRIDFKGRHLNPVDIKPSLPIIFHNYAGKWINEAHIHLYVEEYRPLHWALPLSAYHGFDVKKVENNSDFKGAIIAFFKKIALINKITELSFKQNIL
ncbi:MAG: DUF6978 family protein [Chitinophagales bacterium]